MTTRTPDLNETESIFTSREVAERWHQAKARRAAGSGPANEMMLELANIRAGARVLDVAAGTGDQTILAAQHVGPTGSVVAVDLSPHMLKITDEAIRNAGLENVETRVMNAEKIDFDADSFDAVICRMGLMVFPNPDKALIGMHRVVKPGRKVVALVPSTEENNPCRGIPLGIVRRIGNNLTEVPGLRSLFSLGNPDVLQETFRASGFADVATHVVPTRAIFSSAAEAVRTTMDSFPGLRHLMDQLSEAERKRAWSEIEQQLKPFERPNGFEAPGEVLIGVGTK
jgi:ubiquinone/menaquinone biosynthesis C-methylase UbiE